MQGTKRPDARAPGFLVSLCNASSSDPTARPRRDGSRFPWTLLHQSCIYRRAVTTTEGYALLCGWSSVFGLSAYSIAVFHQSGRTPLLPLYALFQFIAPEELTLRTLYELDAYRAYPKENPPGVTAGAGFLSA